MPYFLSQEILFSGKLVSLAAQEMRHLSLSHRAKVGEVVKLQGPDKKRFLAEIITIAKRSVELRCLQELPVPQEPAVGMVLFQAVVAEKALGFILQKGTELGLEKIVFFNAKNSATKLSKEKFIAKKDHWEKILIEAAKQSERAVAPQLVFVENGSILSEHLNSLDLVYLTDISGAGPGVMPRSGKIGVIVGPEGGLSAEEQKSFKSFPNVRSLSLGTFLLRAETAALSAIAGIRMITGQ